MKRPDGPNPRLTYMILITVDEMGQVSGAFLFHVLLINNLCNYFTSTHALIVNLHSKMIPHTNMILVMDTEEISIFSNHSQIPTQTSWKLDFPIRYTSFSTILFSMG